LGDCQDDHTEKDVEETQRGNGQDVSVSRCPLEQELLGRRPRWYGQGKVPLRFETTHGDVRSSGQRCTFISALIASRTGTLVHLDLRSDLIASVW
jgi:hypothetical protein